MTRVPTEGGGTKIPTGSGINASTADPWMTAVPGLVTQATTPDPNAPTTTTNPNDPDGFAAIFRSIYGNDIPDSLLNQALKAYYTQKSSGNAAGGMDIANRLIWGSDWMKTAHPAFYAGFKAGRYSSYGDYTQEQYSFNTRFKAFYGRDATDSDFIGFQNTGQSVDGFFNAKQNQATVLGNVSDPVKALFSQDELNQVGTGSDQGVQISNLIDFATQVAPTLQQQGIALNRPQLEAWMHQGYTPSQITGPLGQFPQIKAQAGDTQYALLNQNTGHVISPGAFGTINEQGQGTINPQTELPNGLPDGSSSDAYHLAAYRSGQADDRGAFIQEQFQKAMARVNTAFQGTLANLDRNGFGFVNRPRDTGA